MPTVPANIDSSALSALLRRQVAESKARELQFRRIILYVDDEMYGPVDFPWDEHLGRGKRVRFPGYGWTQVLRVTQDQIRCSTTIDKDLEDEYERSAKVLPNRPDYRAALERARSLPVPTGPANSCQLPGAGAAAVPPTETPGDGPTTNGGVGEFRTPDEFL